MHPIIDCHIVFYFLKHTHYHTNPNFINVFNFRTNLNQNLIVLAATATCYQRDCRICLDSGFVTSKVFFFFFLISSFFQNGFRGFTQIQEAPNRLLRHAHNWSRLRIQVALKVYFSLFIFLFSQNGFQDTYFSCNFENLLLTLVIYVRIRFVALWEKQIDLHKVLLV